MKSNLLALTLDLCVVTLTAYVTVVSILPFSCIGLIVFVSFAFTVARGRLRAGHARFATIAALVSILLFVGIVTAAANYRPSKIVERQLSKPIRLPATRVTLAELSYLSTFDRTVFPIRISMSFADSDKDVVIELAQPDTTLGEFLNAVERNTSLRRRFMHCGNGYTILGGGDCCFGLAVRPEQPVDKHFDVDAYAAARDGT